MMQNSEYIRYIKGRLFWFDAYVARLDEKRTCQDSKPSPKGKNMQNLTKQSSLSVDKESNANTSTLGTSSVISETPNVSLSKLSMAGHFASSPEKDIPFSNVSSSTNPISSNARSSVISVTSSESPSAATAPPSKSDFDKAIPTIPETSAMSQLHSQLASTTSNEDTTQSKRTNSDDGKQKKRSRPNAADFTGYPGDVDIFVFGAQELGLDSKTFGQMLRYLVGSTNYCVLTHKRLSGIYIGILIKRSLKDLIPKTQIKVRSTRTGIGNLYGNKGAVGVSFRINRTSFCFVNAHLAANRSNKCLQDRIEDLVLIVQGLDLGNNQIDVTHQFHAMYLLGDLNFRIRGDFTTDKVVNMIEKGNHLKLLSNDELTTLRAPYALNDVRKPAISIIELTDNPLFAGSRKKKAKQQQSKSLQKHHTDPLFAAKLRRISDDRKAQQELYEDNDAEDDEVVRRSQTDPLSLGYDQTIAMFQSNQNDASELQHIDETKQDEEQQQRTAGHQRNATTIIHDTAIDETQNDAPRNRQTSSGSASTSQSRSRASSKASYATGDDEWDDIEDEEEDENVPDEPDDAVNLQTIPEKQRVAAADRNKTEHPLGNTIENANDEEEENEDVIPNDVLLEDEEKVTIDMDMDSASKSRRKRKKRKVATKPNSTDKNAELDEMLNVLPMLQSFVEGPITFPPTYKFDKGRNQYTSKRIPAWCDRILWVSPPHPCINIKQLVYTSSNITPPISDHRPVFSEFHITYNKCWNPPPRSQWLVSIKNFYLFVYPSFNEEMMKESSRATTPRHHHSMGSMDLQKHHMRESTESIVPYLTVHSPMLATCMRTTMGRRVKHLVRYNNSEHTLESNASSMNQSVGIESTASASMMDMESMLCYKFNTKQFVVRCMDNSNLGNGCLWVVIRDDNLLGDVDVIGASAIPLVDTIKLAKHVYGGSDGDGADVDVDGDASEQETDYQKYNDVYVHFKRDVTFATCKRGYIEGQMQCLVMR